MNIIIIGANGDIGETVCRELSNRHRVITAGRNNADIHVDLDDKNSIDAMYEKTDNIDAVVSAAGNVHFGPLTELTEEQFMSGLKNKVMGQINLILAGIQHINKGGSFTLTSGVLDRDPVKHAAGAATANGALAGFVKAAAIEMPNGIRVNVVSPGLLEKSKARYGSLFPGHEVVASERVGRAYAKSIEGAQTGQVIIVE